MPKTPEVPLKTTIAGKCCVIDGDTIQIGMVRLRLAGIDAPELDHPLGQKAKWELVRICKGEIITAEIERDIPYDRLVATCYLSDGRDLSAEMVKRGLALDWPKVSGGKHAAYEPDGARKNTRKQQPTSARRCAFSTDRAAYCPKMAFSYQIRCFVRDPAFGHAAQHNVITRFLKTV